MHYFEKILVTIISYIKKTHTPKKNEPASHRMQWKITSFNNQAPQKANVAIYTFGCWFYKNIGKTA